MIENDNGKKSEAKMMTMLEKSMTLSIIYW